MAEPHNEMHTPEQYEETVDPKNPPNVMVNARTRSFAFWSYFGGIVGLFIIVGIALVYWLSRGPVQPDRDAGVVGTAGAPVAGERTPGGFEPRSRPGSTAEELERRGAGDGSLGALRPLTDLDAVAQARPADVAGRPVNLDDVEVESAEGNMFWIRDDRAKVAVVAAEGSPALRAGTRVDIRGSAEPDGSGGVRIRASEVQVND